MGEVDNQVSRKSQAGTVTFAPKNKVEIALGRNSINVGKMENLNEFKKADEKEKEEKLEKRNQLFARMVDNSMEQNLKLQVQADQKMDKLIDSGWSNISFSGGIPKQKLATIRKDGKWSSTEGNKIKDAKKIFRNADVCTVRELDALNAYFTQVRNEVINNDLYSDDLSDVGKELYGDDSAENMAAPEEKKKDPVVGDVVSYVRSIADMNFSGEMLTDEYLSDHIVDMYRFCDRIQEYPKIKERNPHFFDGIADDSRAMLEGYAAMGENLRALLDFHLKLHGIELVKEKNDFGEETGFMIARLYREDENKSKRHKQRETKQKDYDWLRRNFLFKYVGDNEIRKAETYSGDAFNVKNSMAGVEGLIKKCVREYNLNKDEVDKAVGQMKEIIELRTSIIEEEKEQLQGYKTAKGDDLARFRAALKKNNRRINLLTKNISRYQQYISFALGQRETLHPNTIEFLGKEGMDDLLELVRIRTLVDASDEAIAIAKGEANVKKRTAAEFMDMYADAKQKAAHTKELLDRAYTGRNEAVDKGVELAEKYRLKPTTSTSRLSGMLLDGAGTFKEYGWDVEWIHLAVSYEPTEYTPEFIK
ncbi:MAG: hypothetical protein J6O71_04835, partial [Lachnospiraceae bacterium]|nr:hypothetical protein [Lachnospiraceae bacterium]